MFKFIHVSSAVSVKWYKEDGGANFMRTDLHPYIFFSNNHKLYFSEISQMDAGLFSLLFSPFTTVIFFFLHFSTLHISLVSVSLVTVIFHFLKNVN